MRRTYSHPDADALAAAGQALSGLTFLEGHAGRSVAAAVAARVVGVGSLFIAGRGCRVHPCGGRTECWWRACLVPALIYGGASLSRGTVRCLPPRGVFPRGRAPHASLSGPVAVAGWGTAEARCDRLRVWTAAHGLVGAGGKVTYSHDLLMFEAQAARFRAQLGLDPVSDAALTRARSEAVLSVADLESIRARGREIWARRRADLTAVPPADAEEVADGD